MSHPGAAAVPAPGLAGGDNAAGALSRHQDSGGPKEAKSTFTGEIA